MVPKVIFIDIVNKCYFTGTFSRTKKGNLIPPITLNDLFSPNFMPQNKSTSAREQL